MMEQYRERLKDKKRIVVKIGSSSLQHPRPEIWTILSWRFL